MSNSLTDQELLKRLVSFDSTSVNSNVPIADFICDYLEAPAPGTRIQRLDGGAEGKLNLLIMKGPEPTNDSGLLFSGHMDVVPAVEPEWESDPFDLVEKDGALFGRGSADMLSETDPEHDSRVLVDYIAGRGGSVTVDQLRHGPRRYRGAKDLAHHDLQKLVDVGIGQWEFQVGPNGGRPAERFVLDPVGPGTGTETPGHDIKERG